MSKNLKTIKKTAIGIIVLSLTTIKPFFADGINSIAGVIWSAVSVFIEAGIDFLGGIIMGFCGVMLKLVSEASNQNLYGKICQAFNTVFWFSANYLIPLGIFILILGLIWGLIKGLTYGKQGSKDDPISLVKRTVIAGALIWATPILILGTIGTSINKNSNGKNKVYNASISTPLVPTILDGVSKFDTGKGSGELLITDKKLKLNADKMRSLNNEILKNGQNIIDKDAKSMDKIKFGPEANSSGEEASTTQKKAKNGKTILETLANSMYADSINTWSSEDLLWKILYVIVFIVQPAMIVWNLIQIIWVFVKRVVSLILTACLAPLALAFFPQQSTSEVTTKWLRMLIGYGLTTILTFAFAKLGAFVYTAAVTVQYTDKQFITTVILNFACLAILGFVREMEQYANNLGGNLVSFKSTVGNVVSRLAPTWGERAVRAPFNFTKTAAGIAGKIAKGPAKAFYDGAGKPYSPTKKAKEFGEKRMAKKELRSAGAESFNLTPKNADSFTKLDKDIAGVSPYVMNNGEFTKLPEGAIKDEKAGFYKDANGNKLSDNLNRFGKIDDVNNSVNPKDYKYGTDGNIYKNSDLIPGSEQEKTYKNADGSERHEILGMLHNGDYVSLDNDKLPTRSEILDSRGISTTPVSDTSNLVTNSAERRVFNEELSKGTEHIYAHDEKGRMAMYNPNPLTQQEYSSLSERDRKRVVEIEIDGARQNYMQEKGIRATEKKILSD